MGLKKIKKSSFLVVWGGGGGTQPLVPPPNRKPRIIPKDGQARSNMWPQRAISFHSLSRRHTRSFSVCSHGHVFLCFLVSLIFVFFLFLSFIPTHSPLHPTIPTMSDKIEEILDTVRADIDALSEATEKVELELGKSIRFACFHCWTDLNQSIQSNPIQSNPIHWSVCRLAFDQWPLRFIMSLFSHMLRLAPPSFSFSQQAQRAHASRLREASCYHCTDPQLLDFRFLEQHDPHRCHWAHRHPRRCFSFPQLHF